MLHNPPSFYPQYGIVTFYIQARRKLLRYLLYSSIPSCNNDQVRIFHQFQQLFCLSFVICLRYQQRPMVRNSVYHAYGCMSTEKSWIHMICSIIGRVKTPYTYYITCTEITSLRSETSPLFNSTTCWSSSHAAVNPRQMYLEHSCIPLKLHGELRLTACSLKRTEHKHLDCDSCSCKRKYHRIF